MRWKSISVEEKRKSHAWFAWYPVRINNYEKVWLCKVIRYAVKPYVKNKWEWQYELA